MNPRAPLALLLAIAAALAGCLDQPAHDSRPGEEGPRLQVAAMEAEARIYDGDAIAFHLELQNPADDVVEETVCLLEEALTVMCETFSLGPQETVHGMREEGPIDDPIFKAHPPKNATTTYRILDAEHTVTSTPMPRIGETIKGTFVEMTLGGFRQLTHTQWEYEVFVHYLEDVEEAWLHFPHYDDWPGLDADGHKNATRSFHGTLTSNDPYGLRPNDHVAVDLILWFTIEGNGTASSPEKGDFRWRIGNQA